MDDIELPPLPPACDITPVTWSNQYSTDQMQAYARAAIAADRAKGSREGEAAGWFKWDKVSGAWHPQYEHYAETHAAKEGWRQLYLRPAPAPETRQGLSIDYTVAHAFAEKHRLSYNEVCAVMHTALSTSPAPTQATQDAEQAAAYRWLLANCATYTSPRVPIQLIVQEHADVHRTHGAHGYRKGLDDAIRAAMKKEGDRG